MSEEGSSVPPRTMVGGVDLTETDLTKPFFTDFSVPNTAASAVKREALAALRLAFEAISGRWPDWYYAVRADAQLGHFQLYVIPSDAWTPIEP